MWPTVPPIKSPSSPIMSTCVALDRYQSHQFYYFHLISSFSWFFDHLSIYPFAICRLRILRLFLTTCATSFINTRQSLPLCCSCFSYFMIHSSRWVSNGFVIWLCFAQHTAWAACNCQSLCQPRQATVLWQQGWVFWVSHLWYHSISSFVV